MKKKISDYSRKALSVFMAVLMVFSMFVLAPEMFTKAEAATAGTYKYKVTFEVTDDMDNCQMKWYLYGRTNNGTGNADAQIASGGWTSDKKTGTQTHVLMEGTTSAGVFPTMVKLTDNNGAKYWNPGRSVGGKIHLYVGKDSANEELNLNGKIIKNDVDKLETGDGKGAWFYWNVAANVVLGKANYFDVRYSIDDTAKPYVNTITWTNTDKSVTVPASGTATATTETATAKDQYGVNWYQAPFYALSTTNTPTTTSTTITGVTRNTTRTDKGTLSVTNSAKTWVAGNKTASRDVYLTAYIGEVTTSTTTKITINNIKYNVKFYDASGGQIGSTQEVAHGLAATAPDNPTKAYDNTYHYTWKGWDKTFSSVTSDLNVNPTYNNVSHSFTSEVITKQPTCTESGVTIFTCSCGYSYTDNTVPVAKGHSLAKTEAKGATCTENGNNEYWTCTVCGKVFKADKTTETTVAAETLTAKGHSWGEPTFVWSADKSVCTVTRVCKNDETHIQTVDAEITSVETTPAACETDGLRTYTATATFANGDVVKDTTTAPIAKLGHSYGEPTFTWSENKEKCAAVRFCTNDASHTDTATVEVTSEVTKTATCEEAGVRTYTATATFANGDVRTATVTAPIAKLSHSYTGEIKSNGNGTHSYKCVNGCNTYGGTVKCTYTSKVTKQPTCTEVGETTYTCTVCGYIKTEKITQKGHTWGEPTFVWSEDRSTCTVTRVCENDNTHKDIATKVDITSVVTTEATCETEGLRTYTATATFDNGDFKEGTATKVIPALSHNWGEPTFTWSEDKTSCTATRTCKRDANHTETVTAVVTSEITKKATCEEKGVITYTATAKFDDDTTKTDTATKEIPALSHDWGEPTFTWSEDKTSCTATRTCKRDANHTETVTAVVTSEITTPASCTEEGVRTYTATATFSDGEKKDIKTEAVKKLEHSFTNYVSNNDASCLKDGTETATCDLCKTETNTRTAVGSKKDHSYTGAYVQNAEKTQHAQLCVNGCNQPGEYVACSSGTATCTDKAVCSVCGNEYGNALGHDFTSGIYKVEDDTHAQKCIRCDEYGAPTEHNYNKEIQDDKYKKNDADCSTPLTYYKSCVCGKASQTDTFTVGEALGHDWGEWIIDKAATCKETGKKHRVCARNENHTEEVILAIDPNNHTGTTEVRNAKPATCTDNGYTGDVYYKCCNTLKEEGKPITSLGHKLVKTEKKESTCVLNGNYEYWTCETCQKVFKADKTTETTVEAETLPVNPNKHSFTNYVSNDDATCLADGTKTATCDWCGNATDTITDEGTKKEHSYTGAYLFDKETKTHKQLCVNGCDEYGEAVACAFTSEVITEPTCTEKGSRKYECSLCHGTYTEDISANGHTMVKTEAKPSTCVVNGNNEYYTCTVCDKVYRDIDGVYLTTVEAETLAKLEHSYTGAYLFDEATKTHKQLCVNGCDEYGEATACSFDSGVVTTEPTCTETGVKTFTCSVCHGAYTETVPAKGHTMVKTEAKPSTCVVNGNNEYYTCTVCDKVYRDIDGVYLTTVEAETLAKLEHSYTGAYLFDEATKTHKQLCVNGCNEYGEAVDCTFTSEVTKDPSCAEKGERTYTCVFCGGQYKDEIPALGHSMAKTEAVAPTCHFPGNNEYYTCSVCGKVYKDEEGTTETTVEAEVLAKLPHDNVLIEKVETTCATEGYEKYECKLCGAITCIHDESPKPDHQFTATDIPATCTTKGGTHFECSVCHMQYDVLDGDYAEHTWAKEWTVDTPATCTQNGSKSIHCTVCGAKGNTAVILKLPHSIDMSTPVNAGAGENYTWFTFKCHTCEYRVAQFTIFAKDENGNVIPDAQIKITDSNGNIEKSGKADENGRFCTENTLFKNGNYTVTITADDNHKTDGVLTVAQDGSVSGSIGHITKSVCGHLCHKNNFIGRLIRSICTFFSAKFNRTIKCCDDMEWYGKYAEGLK